MLNDKTKIFGVLLILLIVILAVLQYFRSRTENASNPIDNVQEISQSEVYVAEQVDEIKDQTTDIIEVQEVEEVVEENLGSFDVVRIDRDGVSVLAGRAQPNQKIRIYNEDNLIGEGVSDRLGQWVITIDEEIPNEILNLKISTTNENSEIEVFSDQIVTIMPIENLNNPIEPDITDEIILLTQENEASRILSDDPSFLQDESVVNIRTIDYDEEKLILSGNAEANTEVNAYIDNKFIGKTLSDNLGKWSLNIDENIIPGDYEIRADMVDDQDFVIARTSTKFTRLFDGIDNSLQLNTITIEPGDNLWNISRKKYGSGMQYTVIYLANSNQIVNPDLIFPGQVLLGPGSLFLVSFYSYSEVA
ncbi:MAG: LysM peptidoglycan-binding domain-containing protein [Hyphomicrobiales bacterium]